MIRYAVRVTPWLLLATGCGVVTCLMALVAAWPSSMWPLQGTSLGIIAGVTAMAMDERSASIVDTLPRGLVWRSVARAGLVAPVLLAVWLGCLLAWRDRLPPHLGLFVLQGFATVGIALAVTTWRRVEGVAEPGAPFAAVVIPAAAALALIRPWERSLPLFPIWPSENWALSRTIWTGLATAVPALAAAAVLVHARPRYRRTSRPPR